MENMQKIKKKNNETTNLYEKCTQNGNVIICSKYLNNHSILQDKYKISDFFLSVLAQF